MALSFPNSPSVGDVHEDSASGFSYQWSGEIWKSYKVEISGSLGGNLDADLGLNSNDITGTGDVDITGNLKISGVATATSFVGDGSALTGIDATSIKDSNGTVRVQANPHGAVATGIVTATSFVGDITGDVTGNTSGTAGGLTGSPSITVTDITASGDITVGGTLTYEDVSNVDSVGLVTARTGVRVTAGGIEVSNGGAAITGVTTSTSFVKSGGTSSQFLKADGSVDTSTYITSADGGNAATLDSLDSTQFLRSDAADTKTSGDLSFSDSIKAIFGTGSDLQIYHDGTHSYIDDVGTGDLRIRANNLSLRDTSDVSYLYGSSGGAVTLYYNGLPKMATKSDGIDVTGEVQCDSLDVDGAADITGDVSFHGNLNLDDSRGIRFGASQDLQIYHDGSNSYIDDSGTGDLIIRGYGSVFIQKYTGETCAQFISDGAVDLYHNNSKKFETTSTGVTVSGNVNSTSDINLKKDIEVITDSVDLVKQLSGVKFTWKENDEKSAGVIAQDVEKVLPELVSGNEGEKSVNYSGLIGVLIEAVKEQQKQIDTLTKRIEELEG
jgi:ribonuclease HI